MSFLSKVLGLAALSSGASVGDSYRISARDSSNPLLSGSANMVGNVLDNSKLGQRINDSLGNYQSTSAKEISARNAEMNFNSAEAQANRDWNEYAYKHRIQWAFDDAKAAGLNPYVALDIAGTVPGGSSASYSGYASSLLNSNASRYSSDNALRGSVANSAIAAISRLGYAAIVKK